MARHIRRPEIVMKGNWEVEGLVSVYQERAPDTDWDMVARRLDADDFICTNPTEFQIILDVYRMATHPGSLFPLRITLEDWVATNGLFIMMIKIDQCALKVFDFTNYLGREL